MLTKIKIVNVSGPDAITLTDNKGVLVGRVGCGEEVEQAVWDDDGGNTLTIAVEKGGHSICG